jgi:hypothetical protein
MQQQKNFWVVSSLRAGDWDAILTMLVNLGLTYTYE